MSNSSSTKSKENVIEFHGAWRVVTVTYIILSLLRNMEKMALQAEILSVPYLVAAVLNFAATSHQRGVPFVLKIS